MTSANDIIRNGMSLPGFFRRYPDDTAAEAQFEKWRWGGSPQCPHCESGNVAAVKSRRPQPYRCRSCRRHFSFKTNTPMHDSKLPALTWLLGLFLIVSAPKGKSSVQLASDLGITQKSAWHMSHRIRQALAEGHLPDFDGPIEVDECYIGGKSRNRHAAKRATAPDKTPVFGVVDEPTGQAVAMPVHEVTAPVAAAVIRATTEPGATVHTDSSPIYRLLNTLGYDHHSVIHSIGRYVRDGVTTNRVESLWSGLKRTYIGTHHWWSDEHCHRYVEETPVPVQSSPLPRHRPHGRRRAVDGRPQAELGSAHSPRTPRQPPRCAYSAQVWCIVTGISTTEEARMADELGTLQRRVNSIDQRLERVEGKQDAMLAWQQAHSERVNCIIQRFDDLEKLIRESMNGHGPA